MEVAEISQTAGAMNQRLAEAAAEIGFSAPAEPLRAPHYLCLRRKAPIPKELMEVLAREKVFVSVRGSSIRVTPHVYNTERRLRTIDRLPAAARVPKLSGSLTATSAPPACAAPSRTALSGDFLSELSW